MEPQIESMSLPFSSHCLGRKVEKGESLFLNFLLKQGRERVYGVYVCFLSDELSLEEKHEALLVKWNFLFHMVNQTEGMFVYMTGRGKEKGRINLSPLSPFHVCFSCIKLSLCLCFMRPLSPQALCGSKIWKIVHFAGRLWQNFPRKCAKNYSG